MIFVVRTALVRLLLYAQLVKVFVILHALIPVVSIQRFRLYILIFICLIFYDLMETEKEKIRKIKKTR